MSTNKTPNYQLHSWRPADEFHLTEINENFTALDTAMNAKVDKTQMAALGRLVVGTYTGTGSGTQTIDLGSEIVAVLIECYNGTRPAENSSATQGGLIFPGFPMRTEGAHVDGTSFTVLSGGYNDWCYMNTKNTTYYYIAWVR